MRNCTLSVGDRDRRRPDNGECRRHPSDQDAGNRRHYKFSHIHLRLKSGALQTRVEHRRCAACLTPMPLRSVRQAGHCPKGSANRTEQLTLGGPRAILVYRWRLRQRGRWSRSPSRSRPRHEGGYEGFQCGQDVTSFGSRKIRVPARVGAAIVNAGPKMMLWTAPTLRHRSAIGWLR